MRLVVADTSPIFYLLSIGQIGLLPRLFGTVLIPEAVYDELCHPTGPAQLRNWAEGRPDWLRVNAVSPIEDATLEALGKGEQAALTLAIALHADLILIDERKGTKAALARGFDVTGTLGVLRLAAMRGMIDIADCLQRLKQTNFRYRQETLDALLSEFARQ